LAGQVPIKSKTISNKQNALFFLRLKAHDE